jgi:SHS family sialic acid transporter-like MFS transporter
MAQMNLVNGSATKEFVARGRIHSSTSLDLSQIATPPLLPGIRRRTFDDSRIRRWRSWWRSEPRCGSRGTTRRSSSERRREDLVFGWVGDRQGRVRAMVLSILCYSIFAGICYFASSPEQLLLLRFLSSMGVGGMWPAAVALASEAWSSGSRPLLSGIIGSSANIGICGMGIIGWNIPITQAEWRWVMPIASVPILLAIVVAIIVPESPAWRRLKLAGSGSPQKKSRWEVFEPKLLPVTLIGIALAGIPLLGGWGTTSWLIPWSEKVLATKPEAKAVASIMRAGGGAIGSFLGGVLANYFGRRGTYFAISLASLLAAQGVFWFIDPTSPFFTTSVFVVGFISMIYFGWLPLYLPELFPTHVRTTGSGVSFNFGRIATAFGVLGAGVISGFFNGDYAATGKVTSLVYLLGMIAICFAPDTSKRKLADQQ